MKENNSETVKYNFNGCDEISDFKIIKCIDPLGKQKTSFCGINKFQHKIIKVSVDCLKLKERSCDWLLINGNNNTAFFIELKGHKINDAIIQLGNSIKRISNPENKFIEKKFDRKNAYAITTRIPGGADIQNMKEKFQKKYQTKLIIKNNQIEENLN